MPPRDPAAFAAAITRVADEADDFGFKARAKAACYTVDAMAEGMLAAYRPLLGSAEARAAA